MKKRGHHSFYAPLKIKSIGDQKQIKARRKIKVPESSSDHHEDYQYQIVKMIYLISKLSFLFSFLISKMLK